IGEISNPRNILAVGGSGSRSLPFLALPIEGLTIVDVSSDQIHLIELKLETIRQLSHADALAFWTDESKEVRDEIFSKLSLPEKFKEFYRFQSEHSPNSAPLYWGKWEKTFQTFSKLTKMMFSEKIREGLFTADNPYEF